jgi:hypothetical protein
VRRLLDRYQAWRVAPTRRQRVAATAASGPITQARAVQQHCQTRLAQLGFAALKECLQDRHVGRGWSVRRLCAELGVSHGWLRQQLTGSACAPDHQYRMATGVDAAVEAGGLTTIIHRRKPDTTVEPSTTSTSYTTPRDVTLARTSSRCQRSSRGRLHQWPAPGRAGQPPRQPSQHRPVRPVHWGRATRCRRTATSWRSMSRSALVATEFCASHAGYRSTWQNQWINQSQRHAPSIVASWLP